MGLFYGIIFQTYYGIFLVCMLFFFNSYILSICCPVKVASKCCDIADKSIKRNPSRSLPPLIYPNPSILHIALPYLFFKITHLLAELAHDTGTKAEESSFRA